MYLLTVIHAKLRQTQ